ncbi:hypothetical protein XENOCAPTIV_000685 [Xenoophorus captivus]|uniref:Uncharacterized protein n=1 Tax=Xenoophorus captivus TaxID=1517983 RepID=A0ABV0QXS1_9TELE
MTSQAEPLCHFCTKPPEDSVTIQIGPSCYDVNSHMVLFAFSNAHFCLTGIGISNGDRWRQLRRFSLTTLRDFGMGRKGMEEWIQEESKHLRARIRKLKYILFHLSNLLFFCQEKDNPSTEFHYDNLFATVMNLFIAGTETTSSTIRYALSVLIKHKNIQGMETDEFL